MAIIGMMVAIGTLAFTAPIEIAINEQASMHWYPVDASTDRISGSPVDFASKATVIASQGCKDDPSNPICLYGSDNGNLQVGDELEETNSSNTILRSEP